MQKHVWVGTRSGLYAGWSSCAQAMRSWICLSVCGRASSWSKTIPLFSRPRLLFRIARCSSRNLDNNEIVMRMFSFTFSSTFCTKSSIMPHHEHLRDNQKGQIMLHNIDTYFVKYRYFRLIFFWAMPIKISQYRHPLYFHTVLPIEL